jgi:GTP-binding protein HflX
VFNKIDSLKEPFILEEETIENKETYFQLLKQSWMAKENNPAIFISASKKMNIEELKTSLVAAVVNHQKTFAKAGKN